jgi:hypothetical protein
MEALAAASSVLAVVSLAIQLADNVQRLIDFWDSIKEAPTEVAEIRSQLRILGTLLRGIELDIRYYPSDDEGTLGHDCLLVCKGSIAKLEKLSKEWDQELSRNGIRWKWSCLKKALRENELARYWVELERAKSTLIMHQCLRNGWVLACVSCVLSSDADLEQTASRFFASTYYEDDASLLQ